MRLFCISGAFVIAFIFSVDAATAQEQRVSKAPASTPAEKPVIRPASAKTLAEQPAKEKNAKEIWLEENQVYSVVEIMPSFPGGQDEMNSFIRKNLSYPADAKKARAKGKVTVQFIVEKDGSLNEATVLKDEVGHGAAIEALNVINKMPKWTPGQEGGKPVRVLTTLPFSFDL